LKQSREEFTMSNKSEKKPVSAEAKKQLEAIAGTNIEPEQLIGFRFPVGAFDYTSGSTSWRSIIVFPPLGLSCSDANLLDASGLTTTGTSGQVTFLLSQFVCLPLVRAFAAPISIVATARSSSPFFVTTTLTLVPDPNNPSFNNDVQITLYAWDAAGKPAPSVSIDWRCRLVSLPVIL
jgi:hypothetical protein